MSEVERSALVNYSTQQMYDLVNDVNRYSEFLPGCISSKVIEETGQSMVALMELKKGPVRQTFTTSNTLVNGQSIVMELLDGPFDYLHGGWNFRPLTDAACKVELDLSFKFSNRFAAAAFNRIFTELTSRLVDSFVSRAEVVYGK